MRWFRLLHLFIIGFLGIVTLVATISAISLLRPSNEQLATTRSNLAALLVPPAPLNISTSFAIAPEKISLKFGKTVASTASATLLRHVTPDEALFLPSFQPTTLGVAQPLMWYAPPSRIQFTWDEAKVRAWVASVSATIDTKTELPRVSYVPKNKPAYTIFPGKAGVGLDEDATTRLILREPSQAFELEGVSRPVSPPLTAEQLSQAQSRVSKLLEAPLTFTAQGKTLTLSLNQLARLISLPDGFSVEAIAALVEGWANEFDLEVVEPELAFDGKKITTFKAPIEGRKLDREKSVALVHSALLAMEETGNRDPQELVVIKQLPKVTLESLNNLGITERIGRGDSDYAHSIPNRVFNVSLASSRIHGVIIAPGEIFSFNKALGEVSAATGYKQAYVIDRGQTVLGDGGGVCQVSSTFFRALLDAGLPILERRGHSYRVGYYEQNSRPGFDATVSAPHPDLTFLNDTGAPILINAQADAKKVHLYIELYGKSDGRKSEITDYKQWDNTPAPAPLYQDDPTLPAGTLKQIDFAAGGLKTSFQYKVTYPSGEVKTNTYLTNYVPWRAVFLRGTR